MKKTTLFLCLLVIMCSCEVPPLAQSPILVSKSIKEADSLKTFVCEYRQVCPIEYTDSIASFRMVTRCAFVEKAYTRLALFPPFPEKSRMKFCGHYQFVAYYDTTACYETIWEDPQYEHRNYFDLVLPRIDGWTFRNMIFETLDTDTTLSDTISFLLEYTPIYWRYSQIADTVPRNNVCDTIVFVKVK